MAKSFLSLVGNTTSFKKVDLFDSEPILLFCYTNVFNPSRNFQGLPMGAPENPAGILLGYLELNLLPYLNKPTLEDFSAQELFLTLQHPTNPLLLSRNQIGLI
ncbi:unnamed protein product [Phytomonas sp. Hart1]|nr:unnamed protein product [Phytomonas sp. Hart1]|eukprot:CCW67119.1 unnamed protein product [Phytomonas sp. isolate Hart1]